jgi:hypothetical protein
MTYFEAKELEALFRRYRAQALEYWQAVEPAQLHWMNGPGQKLENDTEQSLPLRSEIMRLLPEVEDGAQRLGVGYMGQSYPAPMIGGPVIPVNFFSCVVDRRAGHTVIERERILDIIDRCIGAAEVVKKRAFWRVAKPWNWLIDIPALIVGWPFAVMRKVGVPDQIVESTGAQVLKTILTWLIWLGGLVYAAIKTGVAAALAG